MGDPSGEPYNILLAKELVFDGCIKENSVLDTGNFSFSYDWNRTSPPRKTSESEIRSIQREYGIFKRVSKSSRTHENLAKWM